MKILKTLIMCLFIFNLTEASLHYIETQESFDALYPSFSSYEFSQDPEVTTFIMVRHGENESNVNRTYDGRTLNLPLTEKGHQQAIAAGEHIREKIDDFEAILRAPVIRSEETAIEIMEAFGYQLDHIADERLCERYLGEFEGLKLSAYDEHRQKELAISHDKDIPFEEKMAYKATPTVESIGEVYQRMEEGLLEYAEEHSGQKVLVIGHSGNMRALFWQLTAKQQNAFVEYYRFKPSNGCLYILEVKDNNLELKALQGVTFKNDV